MRKSVIILFLCLLQLAVSAQMNLDSIKFTLGFPTLEDLQQYPISPSSPVYTEVDVAPKVDLSNYCPPAGHQGFGQGSCSAWAVAYGMMSYHENYAKGRNRANLAFDSRTTFSPSFVFDFNKATSSPCECASGVKLEGVMKILNERGCCFWETRPYDRRNDGCCTSKISFEQLAEGAKYKVDNIVRIDLREPRRIYQIKYLLSKKLPVAISLTIDSIFAIEGNKAAAEHREFIWQSKDPKKSVGNHSMLCVGYDDTKQTFKVLNSYGAGWGKDGFVQIPYAVFNDRVYDALYIKMNVPFVEPEAPRAPPVELDNNTPGATNIAYKIGDRVSIGDVEIEIAALRSDHRLITINVMNSTNMKLLYSIDCLLHATKVFYYKNKEYRFTFNNATPKLNAIENTELYFAVKQADIFESPLLQGIMGRIQELKSNL